MKKLAAVLIAFVLLLSLSSCDRFHTEDRDRYEYDTYLSALWGMSVPETARAIGVKVSDLTRQDDQTGRPDGSYSYVINKYSTFMGRPITVELIFADSLFGLPQYIGLYAVKITCEEEPYEIPADATPEEREELKSREYHLDGEGAIEDLDYRLLYNRVTKADSILTADYGTFATYSWSSPYSLTTIPTEKNAPIDALNQAMESFTWTGVLFDVSKEKPSPISEEEAKQQLLSAPLSQVTLYYDNPDYYSYLVYNGLPAAILRNLGK